MQHILSYPRYFPKPVDFRSNLLLYDRVSTIVPWNDQARVLARPEISELTDNLPQDTFCFFDPTAYYSRWADQRGAGEVFETIMRELLDVPGGKDLPKAVRVHIRKSGDAIKPKDALHDRLSRANWQYLSYSKMPRVYSELLFREGLAIPVEETELTERPLLIHPRLGDYLISRLTRQIASTEQVAPVATTNQDLGDFLIDTGLTPRDQRAQLLAFTLEVAVPEEIAELPVGQFCAIRDSLAETRRSLSETLQEFLVSLNIDSDRDARIFRERLDAHRSDIETRISAAQQTVIWRGFTKIGIDIIASATGGAVGAALGGIPGAMVGGSLGVVAAKAGASLSTRIFPEDAKHIDQLAVLKNTILREHRAAALVRSNYHL